MRSELRPSPQLVIIGVPASKRTQLVVDAARSSGFSRIDVLTWRDACEGPWAPESGALIRFESPSDCLDTLRLILQAGIEPMQQGNRVPLGCEAIQILQESRGEILHPRQWFLGLQSLLMQIQLRWRGLCLQWMSTPESIVTAFDKIACLERWESAQLPVPSRYGPVTTYDQLRRIVPETHARLFIKLRYGYSAMGAVALEWQGEKVRAITTVEVVWSEGRPRLYVTKRPKTLHREFEIAWLIDTLAMEEIVVEKWLPKDRWQGRSYDLRMVMIGGRARHVVGRASPTPFTNLNLDASRISREEIVERMGPKLTELSSLAQRAVEQLPGAGMLGLDVIVKPRQQGFVLLEANAFGDYLPGLQHEGETTYSAQFNRWCSTAGASA